MNKHILLKEGIPTLVVILALTALLYLVYPYLAIIGIGALLFVLYFFRDPQREVEVEDSYILAPADGLITDISEVDEDIYIKDRAIRVSIFMSPLDVHINRGPIKGTIEYLKHQKGKFIPATRQESHIVNEKNYIGIKNNHMKILVVQIAGIMARRIVHWLAIGQSIGKGDKIGMIKFSSGTQIYLPKETEILVKKGDKIKSGITKIGRYDQ